MSWSVNAIGTKAKVREACVEQFDNAARMYEGKTEQKDVLDCKAAVLAAIDDDAARTPNEKEGLRVTAYGSRSDSYGTVSFTVNVDRVILEL